MDTHAADLPGNSIAAARQQAHWETHQLEVEAQARKELTLLCAVPGPVLNEYLDYCADRGPMSITDYVSMLERNDADRWTRTVDLIFQQQFCWGEQ